MTVFDVISGIIWAVFCVLSILTFRTARKAAEGWERSAAAWERAETKWSQAEEAWKRVADRQGKM